MSTRLSARGHEACKSIKLEREMKGVKKGQHPQCRGTLSSLLVWIRVPVTSQVASIHVDENSSSGEQRKTRVILYRSY